MVVCSNVCFEVDGEFRDQRCTVWPADLQQSCYKLVFISYHDGFGIGISKIIVYLHFCLTHDKCAVFQEGDVALENLPNSEVIDDSLPPRLNATIVTAWPTARPVKLNVIHVALIILIEIIWNELFHLCFGSELFFPNGTRWYMSKVGNRQFE